MNDVTEENSKYISEIYLAIKEIAKQEGIAEDGYRVISNCGKDAGQTVFHLHFHILGGQHLGEKLIKM